ncbi:MAG: DUF4129 domain-containing protein [Pseudomonadota bacterium]
MKAGKYSRSGTWILAASAFAVLVLGPFPDLLAGDRSSTLRHTCGDIFLETLAGDDSFMKRYDLPADPKAALESILARDEFKDRGESWPAQVRRRMEEAFIEALKWILRRIPSIGPLEIDDDVGRMILDAQLIGIIALVGGLFAWLLVRLIRAGRLRAGVQHPSEDHDPPPPSGSAEALRSARAMAEQGNYRDALIYLFRYVLTRLDEKGKLIIGPGKTNREVLNSVPVEEPLRAPLAEMIPLFNRVRYGDADCGKDEFRRFEALCRRVTEGT